MSLAALPSIVASRYAPKRGAHIRPNDAVLLGEVMEKLEADNRLQPSELIRMARPKRSPIHHLWNWDIQSAAEAHWLNRARYYMQSIVLRIEYDTGDIEDVRAFHVTRSEDEEDDEDGPVERRWLTIGHIQENEAYSDAVIATAKDELAAFNRKYKQYRRVFGYERTMGAIHNMIEQVVDEEEEEEE